MYSSNQESSGDDKDGALSYTNKPNVKGTKPKFKFPLPPRLSKSANNSYISSQSDSSNSTASLDLKKRKSKLGIGRKLPPLGIFWDIENCCVPKSKSASSVVQKIREVFLENYRESEFIVVCDVKKENPHIIQELHDSQVNLIHVSSTSKNAADEKLRQSLRRFAEVHPAPSAVILISGDINFAADLSDLRYRKKIRVILLHNVNIADALILCANEHHSFTELTEGLPVGKKKEPCSSASFLTVLNLPLHFEPGRVKSRLHMLSGNCGGKCVETLPNEGIACLRFMNFDLALRAQKRIQGEDVYGSKINVLPPSVRSYSGSRLRSVEYYNSYQSNFPSVGPGPMGYNTSVPPGFSYQDMGQNYYGQSNVRDHRRAVAHQPQESVSQQSFQETSQFRPLTMGASQPMEVNLDQSWSSVTRMGLERRPCTPQDQLSAAACALPIRRIEKASSGSEYSDDSRVNYQAENSTKPVQPVDLIISNLDPTVNAKELQRLLTNMIKEYAMILSLNVITSSDGSPIANIRVNSQQEAQMVISQLHRQKLGHKRIIISYAQTNQLDPEHLRVMVISILQEVPEKRMPLFTFLGLLESKYHFSASLSDIKKLKDVVQITEHPGGRSVSLTHKVQISPPPNMSRTVLPYCVIHCPNGIQNKGWYDLYSTQAPNLMVSLRGFASKLMELLNLHSGCMPLLSFQMCYEQEFHESLPIDYNGVHLEHLISCVPNVEIKLVGPNNSIKVIKHEIKGSEGEESQLKSVAPPLAPNVNLLCRELVDLLKTSDKCQMLLSKFIPAYHHHFGRQCRVADYGFVRLLDLFESISHVVQIMGEGARKFITLTHNAQMRRFTSDMLRVLKLQPSKQLSITGFPCAYDRIMKRTFNAVEYGLCTLEDLLEQVPDNVIVVNQSEEGVVISVPKREQTVVEMMKTRQFANEVIDLLRLTPYYTMRFDKFVPSYHHHFGHQCKVSDYGFTKLMDLFDAIPDIVKIEELPDGERAVSLTLEQSLKILRSQIMQIFKEMKVSSLKLEDLPAAYLTYCGYPLKPEIYECVTIGEVVEKLGDNVQVIYSNAGSLLVLVDTDDIPNILRVRSWALLLNPPHSKELTMFKYEYRKCYNSSVSMDTLSTVSDVITVSSSQDRPNCIYLTALYVLAAQLYHIVCNNGGSVAFHKLEKLYYETYNKPLNLSDYHIGTVRDFSSQFSLLFFVRSNKRKNTIVLNRNLIEHLEPLSSWNSNSSHFENNSASAGISANESHWPPRPSADLLQGAKRKIWPPKPDTPPSPTAIPWNEIWTTPNRDRDINLSIRMPICLKPKLLENTDPLDSPSRFLMRDGKSWEPELPATPASPHPNELPIPHKFLPKEGVSDDSADSGVNTKMDNSAPSDNENDSGTSSGHYGAHRFLWNLPQMMD